MRFKKLLGITLLAIPLYFFTPNAAKAEEFKINLKDKGITTEQIDYKKGNIFNDLEEDIIQNAGEFAQRANDKIEKRIYEDRFLLDISPETRSYLFNWENATKHMNDTEKKIYMDKVNKDIEKIVMKEFRKEAQEEFKDSRFYEWFKDELGYYKVRVREKFSGDVKVREKEAYITNEGGINLHFKREEFKNIPESERFKLKFKWEKLSVRHTKYFEFNMKAKPFSFHKWNYNPGINFDLITKYCSIYGKTAYYVRDEKLKSSVTTSLPEGFVLGLDYNLDSKKETTALTTSISKNIKDYNLSLSYTKAHDSKNSSDNRTVMFNITKTW